MKCLIFANPSTLTCRAPQGARGLKLRLRAEIERDNDVAPRKGRVG